MNRLRTIREVVTIDTTPSGASVYVDYADASLGVTPLTVSNLAAASHTILLKKDSYLQPMPVVVNVRKDETNSVAVPLNLMGAGTNLMVQVESSPSNMPVYVDYLPTAHVTAATLDYLDAASHAGSGWHSASHTIMLVADDGYHSLPYWVDSSVTETTQTIRIELYDVEGMCSFTVTPPSISAGSEGASGSLTVEASGTNCEWTAEAGCDLDYADGGSQWHRRWCGCL